MLRDKPQSHCFGATYYCTSCFIFQLRAEGRPLAGRPHRRGDATTQGATQGAAPIYASRCVLAVLPRRCVLSLFDAHCVCSFL